MEPKCVLIIRISHNLYPIHRCVMHLEEEPSCLDFRKSQQRPSAAVVEQETGSGRVNGGWVLV